VSWIGHHIVRWLMPEWAPPAWSLGFHTVVLLLLSVSLTLGSDPSRLGSSGIQTRAVIEATVVDAGAIEAEMARQAEIERRQQAAADQTIREREAEQARLAELERQRQVSERQAAVDAERQRQAQADAAAQAAADQQRLDDLRQQQEQEAEQLRQLQVQQAEAERRRQQAEAEALLQQQMADEARRQQVVNAGYQAQYEAAVRQRVERNWIPPGEMPDDFYCEAVIGQIPGGEVISVAFGQCNADAIWRRSLETAVRRASPLPGPPPEAPEVFERQLRLRFRKEPDE
jgi:colicin import membrane protein